MEVMKRTQRQTSRATVLKLQGSRQGSTLLVVLALLGALSFLGFFFYTMAAQEAVTAQYYADAAKDPDNTLDPDILFDHALRQIMLGADNNEYNSALWGGRASFLATLFGRDMHPYSGQGVNAVLDASNLPDVDQDFNGTPDGNTTLIALNDSPPARESLISLSSRPDPDVDYTYPDINNPFLAFNSFGLERANTEVPVLMPSYHRPQLLRNFAAIGDWYVDSSTQTRVFRPHKEHMAFDNTGTITSYRRFISSLYTDSDVLNFPFPDELNSATAGTYKEGVWDTAAYNTSFGGSAPSRNDRALLYSYDVDADGDGIKEAIWLDLDFPVQEGANGTYFVPMYGITILDADGLANLNTSGNIGGLAADISAGTLDLTAAIPLGNNSLISKSNYGLSPSEVNPQYGLSAGLPSDMTQLKQHLFLFGHNPADDIELSNMELWMLMSGRADFNTDGTQAEVTDVFPGRNGEASRLYNAIRTASGGAQMAHNFPFPGTSGADDNRNRRESGRFVDTQLYPSAYRTLFPAFEQPVDFRAVGTRVLTGTNGRQLLTGQVGRHIWPAYRDYFTNSNVGWRSTAYSSTLMPGVSNDLLDDEGTELIVDPTKAKSSDDTFGSSENAALQFSDGDLSTSGKNDESRVLKLAPQNLKDGSRAEETRKRFTVDSYDFKSFSRSYMTGASAFRAWEFRDTNSDGFNEFPPFFGASYNSGTDPFRVELRSLLFFEAGDRAGADKRLLRKLSLNGVLDWDNPGSATRRLRFRPLTPHPTDEDANGNGILDTGEDLNGNSVLDTLANTPVSSLYVPMSAGPNRPEALDTSGTNAQRLLRQEWLARYDRQRMARDIFVMLYTFGGGIDGVNYANPGSIPYTRAQIREMAQFAVNTVDSLDPDDTITKFEYDRNLLNGWNLDDNAYTTDTYTPYLSSNGSYDSDYPEDSDDRGVVFGVERQLLTFNEVHAILARRVKDKNDMTLYADHGATEYDDAKHRDFTYIELQNVSPKNVNFATHNDGWQIVVRPGDYNGNPSGEERRLTIRSGAGSVGSGAGPLYSIGTGGDGDNVDGSSNLRPSYVNVIENYDPMNPPAMPVYTRLTPAGGLSLDLLTDALGKYRVNESDPGSGNALHDIYADGPQLDSTSILPSGTGLLELKTPSDPTPDVTLDGYAGSNGSGGGGISPTITIELRRRANLHRSAPQVAGTTTPVNVNHRNQSVDNPWITVDTIEIKLNVLNISPHHESAWSGAGGVEEALQKLRSEERKQPLYGNLTDNDAAHQAYPAGGLVLNSLGQQNNFNISPYTLYQPINNRDFASPIELFDVPLYGPHELTEKLGSSKNLISGGLSAPRLVGQNTAGGKILRGNRSDWENGRGYAIGAEIAPSAAGANGYIYRCTVAGTSAATAPAWGPATVTESTAVEWTRIEQTNRWYRLLEMTEVPTRVRRGEETVPFVNDVGRPSVSDPDTDFATSGVRVPGLVNPNTLRSHTTLAGLLDDQDVFNFKANNASSYLTDNADGSRDWWVQFIKSRDGADPVLKAALASNPDIHIPGIPGAKPFRSLNFTAEGNGSLENTVLRSLPNDGVSAGYTAEQNRRLFQVGTLNDHLDQTATPQSYTSKYRLLAKMMNNTTTRSNVFFVFVQVDFFEAKEIDLGGGNKVIRVGAMLPDSPGHRGFFVIDRSKALEYLEKEDLPRDDGSRFTFSFNRREDDNGNGVLDAGEDDNNNGVLDRFPFRSLILHREIIP